LAFNGGSYFDVLSLDAARFRDIPESVENEALTQNVVGFKPPGSSGRSKPGCIEVQRTPIAGRDLLP
jgi:hypothetical protein